MKRFILVFTLFVAFLNSDLKALPFGTYLGEFQGVPNYSNGSVLYVSKQTNTIGGIASIKWQCVEFARRFLNTKYGVTISTGNASAQATNTLGSGMTRYLSNSSFIFGAGTPISVGDAIVSDYTGGSAVGHIAIVREIQANKIIVIQQNWTQDAGDSYFECAKTNYANGTFAIQFSASYKIKAIIHANSNNPQPAAQPTLQTPAANATNLSGNINFTWTCPNATEYRIQIIETNLATTFSTANGFSGAMAYNANIGNINSFLWTGAQPGKSYYWSVRANNASGTTGFAPYRSFSTATFLSVTPTSQSVSNTAGNTSFSVNTNASAWSVTSNVSWATPSKSGSFISVNYQANTSTSSRTATLTVTAGNQTQYLYIYQAGAATCNTPANLSCPSKTKNTLTLSWGSVAGAVNYTVNLKASFMTGWTAYTTSNTGGMINGLTPGYTYNAQVRANCANGSSAWSGIINITLPTSLVNPNNGSTLADAATERESQVEILIPNQELDDASISIYPNPSSGLISAEYTSVGKDDITVQILNVEGKVILQKQIAATGEGFYKENLDLLDQPNGLYFIKITQGNIIKVAKTQIMK